MRTHAASQPATRFTPAVDRAALNAECLRSILAGVPLPESVRPRPAAPRRPATAAEGIAWILAGPGPTAPQ